MIDRDEIYALHDDLYGYKPENDLEVYENIDETIEFFSEILGYDLHFEPLFEQIKIRLDEIFSESNVHAEEGKQEKTCIQN